MTSRDICKLSSSRDSFNSLNLDAFKFFFFFLFGLIAGAKPSSTVLKRSVQGAHSCLIPHVRKKYFRFWPLSMMLAVGIHMKPQKPKNSQIKPEREQTWRHHTSWFKINYETTVTTTAWYLHDDSHIDQKNRIESRSMSVSVWSIDFWQGCQEYILGR